MFKLASTPIEAHADGLFVYDDRGDRYLDCGGYCVFLLGHGHPAVREAVLAQLQKRALATRTMVDPLLGSAAEALAAITPDRLDYVWLANSGSEAVEAALKVCRLNGCRTLVSAQGAFHGKTTGALSITGKDRYRAPFEPLLGGVTRVPFGDIDAIQEAVEVMPGRCAVVLEPLQSEAGVIAPPRGYLPAVRDLCDREGAILVLDEISTGLGRTGRWWCGEHDGVLPDVLVLGKALGGGVVPASAIATTPELFEPLNRDPLLHTSTFAGNPLAAVAVVAALGAMRAMDVPSCARRVGKDLLGGLRAVANAHTPGLVAEVRGRGLLIGIEMEAEHLAADLMLELLERHVLVSHSLNAHTVVRVTPPATIDEAAADWLLGAVDESLHVLAGRYGSRAMGQEREAIA